MAVDCVGVQTVDHLNRIFQVTTHDFNVSSNALKRTGHARFRRGPSSSSSGDTNGPSTSRSTSSSTIVSSLAEGCGFEETVSNGKSLGIVAPAPTFSSRKPPLPSNHRKRCSADRPVAAIHGSRSGCRHCCKRRKTGSKREIRKVSIIGSKITSMPTDDYSWKKYGECIT